MTNIRQCIGLLTNLAKIQNVSGRGIVTPRGSAAEGVLSYHAGRGGFDVGGCPGWVIFV